MKQQIKAVGAKTKRFTSQINQYQQNLMFVNDQEQFFQRSNNEAGNCHLKFQILCEGTDILEGYRERKKGTSQGFRMVKGR